MTTIRDVINALVVVQGGLEITVPRPVKVAKAWNYSPPQNESLASALPAFTNSWDMLPIERMGGQGRWRRYAIHMQFYAAQVTRGDDSLAADIATAFEDSIETALGQRNAAGLGGYFLYGDVGGEIVPTIQQQIIRGGSPTLAILERGGAGYVGLDLFLDVALEDTFAHS